MKRNFKLILLILFTINSHSQEFFKGNIGIFYDTYFYSDQNHSGFRPIQPENTFRLSANVQLNINKNFSIPLSVSLSNQNINYNLPSIPNENIIDYIKNPVNNISINPKYKWFKAFIGTQTPSYSKLTTGVIPLFGLGFDINPGKFIFSINYGTTQRAIEPNIANPLGAFKQNYISTRIGIGKIESSKFTLNFVKIKDDINSIDISNTTLKPIESATFSPLIQFKIGSKIEVLTETAISMITDDILDNNSNSLVNFNTELLTINSKSKFGYGHLTKINYKNKNYLLGGELNYSSARFNPTGFRFVERDFIDYKINSFLSLFKNKYNFTGSFGIRNTNTQDLKNTSTKRILFDSNLTSQITKNLQLNLSYTNFGFTNIYESLSNKIEITNNALTISPMYQFISKNLTHNITLNYSNNTFNEYSNTFNNFTETTSINSGLRYNVTFKNKPLNLACYTNKIENSNFNNSFIMIDFGVNTSYSFFNKKITPNFNISYAKISKQGFTDDSRININLRLKYKITKKLIYNMSYQFIENNYGSSRQNNTINQQRINFSLEHNF